MAVISKDEYTKLQDDYGQAEEWVRDLSYAILSLQTGDSQQFGLAIDYYEGVEFVDDKYVKALIKSGVLEPTDLTEDGKMYVSDLHIKEYRHMHENQEPYTRFLWNTELFRANFSLWGWIVRPDVDYEEYQRESDDE